MQALAGTRTSLGCSDCKTNFSSASSLLRHFAEHISGVTAREGSTESESDDARSESILERALRSSASGSSSAESPASISDEINKKTMDEQIPEISITKIEAQDEVPMMYELTKGHNNNNNNNNNNNTSNKHVMYVKLDLQKRVENCVHHLKGSGDSSDEDSAKGDSTEEGTTTAVETDDFNPLKFCVVTLEEGSEKIELNESKVVSLPPVNNLPITDPQQQQQYKKYVCTYCFKRFGWSTDLKRHILTHTGERPFQCQLCGATFTRNFLLQKHVLKLHNKPAEQTAPPLASIKSEPSLTTTQIDLSPHTLKDSPLSLSKRRKQGILVEGDKS